VVVLVQITFLLDLKAVEMAALEVELETHHPALVQATHLL
jgi:hypothetical protein